MLDGSTAVDLSNMGDGTVFIGRADHTVRAFNSNLGSLAGEHWNISRGEYMSVYRKVVAPASQLEVPELEDHETEPQLNYVCSGDGQVRAFDRLSGQHKWNTMLGSAAASVFSFHTSSTHPAEAVPNQATFFCPDPAECDLSTPQNKVVVSEFQGIPYAIDSRQPDISVMTWFGRRQPQLAAPADTPPAEVLTSSSQAVMVRKKEPKGVCRPGLYSVAGVVDAGQALDVANKWQRQALSLNLNELLEDDVPPVWHRGINAAPKLLTHVPRQPFALSKRWLALLCVVVLLCGVGLGVLLRPKQQPRSPPRLLKKLSLPSQVIGHEVGEQASPSKHSKLLITDRVLGHGSHGTMVFQGQYDERPVAVKRMLREYYDRAELETQLLMATDQHQAILR